MDPGMRRQQLYIGKLHPCMCSNKEILQVQEYLSRQLQKDLDFVTTDRDIVRKTSKFIRREWGNPESR